MNSEISVTYHGYVFDASGYGHAARAYIHALHRTGVRLSVADLAGRDRQVSDPLVESLVNKTIETDFHLFHGIPPQWARQAFRLSNVVGMTVWETDVMPPQWRNALSHVLELWLPCEFNVTCFGRALRTPIFKVPHAKLSRDFNGDMPEPNGLFRLKRSQFVFYSLFEWQNRKCPDGLIESYLRAFRSETDVVLIVKSNPDADAVARRAVDEARRTTGSNARVDIRCEAWCEAQVEALHSRGDCYVSLHRGEGWGYPLFEAASRGTPVIATGYSGPLEYLNPEDHCLVDYKLGAVRQAYQYYQPHMRWAEPDFDHAVKLMRWVYENRESAKAQALRASRRISQSYSLDAIGGLAKERLIALLKRTRAATPPKSRIADSNDAGMVPTIPIPPEWYDAAYFDNGLKSNWSGGYRWASFSGLFRETGAFLTDSFSEAESFLDVGCAKGFLVRSLRERGKECWGFDHSAWAVDHAEPSAKPYLIRAAVDDVTFDRQFDVLAALSVFESLSEAQCVSFLSRARAWTRVALFATIPSFDQGESESALRHNDRDLSHITMRSRGWWRDLFIRAGWRQDSVHKTLERFCQNHSLPKKMRWKVYVYAPH